MRSKVARLGDLAPYRYAYLHGFASGPQSFKGVKLSEAFEARGHRLNLPDLNAPSFAQLSFTGSLKAMDRLDERDDRPWRLIGSSMGGYLACRWASLRPERVDRLILLCPGFNMVARWMELLGEQTIRRWRSDGFMPVPDVTGSPVNLWWDFMADAAHHPPFPEFNQPTLIIHGSQDETIPIASSEEVASANTHVRLIEVHDDHGLASSIETIGQYVFEFFDLEQKI